MIRELKLFPHLISTRGKQTTTRRVWESPNSCERWRYDFLGLAATDSRTASMLAWDMVTAELPLCVLCSVHGIQCYTCAAQISWACCWVYHVIGAQTPDRIGGGGDHDLASYQNRTILIFFCSGVKTIPPGNWYFYHIKWQNVVTKHGKGEGCRSNN